MSSAFHIRQISTHSFRLADQERILKTALESNRSVVILSMIYKMGEDTLIRYINTIEARWGGKPDDFHAWLIMEAQKCLHDMLPPMRA